MKLKPFILLITNYILLNTLFGQNLVQNHSFENYITLPNPNGYNLENYVYNWQNINSHTGSPDYFHFNSSGNYSIPINNRGFQGISDSFAYRSILAKD